MAIFDHASCLDDLFQKPINGGFQIVDDLELEFRGKPDLVFKAKEAVKYVVIEAAFDLDFTHIHKDFKYLMDPKLKDKITTFIWICDKYEKNIVNMIEVNMAKAMVECYANQLGIFKKVRFVALKPNTLFDAHDHCLFHTIFSLDCNPTPSLVEPSEGIRNEFREKWKANNDLLTKDIIAILGVTVKWVINRIQGINGLPKLNPKKKALRRGGQYCFELDQILKFIDEFEKYVKEKKKLSKLIPLIKKGGSSDLISEKSKTMKDIPAVAFCVQKCKGGVTLLYNKKDVPTRL